MADHLESVKALAAQYGVWAKGNEAEKPAIANRQRRHAADLEAVVAELSDARRRLRPVPTSYGDLSDLPEQVLAELSLVKVDELEQQLRDIVVAADSEIGLDPIIIELWRRHKIAQPRRAVMNKLYRMAQKGLIISIEGRKGVYTAKAENGSAPPRSSPFDSDLDDDVPF